MREEATWDEAMWDEGQECGKIMDVIDRGRQISF